jgi:ribosomal 50S subunit-recycling heat shock protein
MNKANSCAASLPACTSSPGGHASWSIFTCRPVNEAFVADQSQHPFSRNVAIAVAIAVGAPRRESPDSCARLCIAGAVTVNQVTIRRANHIVRIGDTIAVPQGAFRRTVRLLGLGARRGPAAEARLLYEEIGTPVRLNEPDSAWQLWLIDG